ncbi:MAG: ABC transporter permease [Spirochaetes bacterium RIFOXYC1_FULL_54_7]|nr:MAG: ABC transporter permease [Spirochaetes bacterium RIFOXYC1_FULL_54_7]
MVHRKISVAASLLIAAILTIFIIWTFFPIYWMFSTSIKSALEVFNISPELFPKNPTLEHYYALDKGSIKVSVFLKNSIITGLGTVILAMFLALFAGYALSRFRFRMKKFISLGILTTQMFPLVVLLIPLYLLYKRLNLLNSYIGLILSFTSFTLPFSIWMLKGFIDSIPIELEESAIIDGCSKLQILFHIVTPLIVPGLVATMVFAFLDAWNNLLFPLMLVTRPSMKTLPPGMVLAFAGEFKHNWGGMMATSVIVSLPVVVVFVTMQKYLVQGLTAGAVKG